MTSCLCAYLSPEEKARGRVCTPCMNGRQGSLFGSVPRPELLEQKSQMHQGAGPEDAGRPVDAADAHTRSRASSDHAVIPPPQGVSGERQSIGATAANGVRRARGSEIPHPDILRIIEANPGPFVLLYDGKPSGRYYQIVETRAGEFLHRDCDESGRCETDRNDWSPVPADSTRRLVEDGLRNGTMRVVEVQG